MDIPYTVEAHPETGLNNGKIGIWLFLTTEVMLFGALFATYVFLRVGALDWHHQKVEAEVSVPLATINTIVLIASSVTVVMAWASLVRKRFDAFRWYMIATVGAGAIFMVIKGIEYNAKFSHHHYPETSAYLAIYFTMTGLHALHVLGGMGVNLYLAFPGSKLWKTDPQWFTNRVEHSGLFWHFVDLVWIFLFPLFYLL